MKQPLNGSLAASLQAPALQQQQLADMRALKQLPVNSPEFDQLWAIVSARAYQIRKAKAADDLLIHQVFVNLGISTRRKID